ncbi:helix-turn-helix domain-containing protein [Geoalkalibacter halelectricus]|uniref:Helix-turn-helix domain-containing protein n=1 Tax=Geoalkalibacter halelectricus TaxID=2847045 RepID=A0ABY5ZQE8_9BACT|nr:helix-turn-helix domain-containing protein [Geoalkalibacter halelectricus]MDO3379298.1 helix-turn-helix domain-containing protein [Geoalkalibacter halelectricus]UWZ81054.1 helix-turn-helix domain-containing protein [Geoalkalibacter halelectricus]
MDDTSTQGFGEKLKNRRQERGLSLDEVALQLRIRRQFIEALEDERWEAFPGETYLKGFLRSYAEFLDLDPGELLVNYRQRRPEGASTATQLRRIETELIESVPLTSSTKRTLLVLLLILLLAGLLGYWLSRPIAPQAPLEPALPPVEQQPSVPTPPLVPADEEQEEIPATEPLLEEPGDPESADPNNQVRSPAMPPGALGEEESERSFALLRPEGSNLRVQAERATRLDIVLDDRPAQGYQLQAGAVVTWQARSFARLSVQDPQAISLWVDQQPLPKDRRLTTTLTALPAQGER